MPVQIKNLIKCRYVTLWIATLAFFCTQSFTQSAPLPIAFVGQASPIGGTYLSFPGTPVLNEAGQIAYYSNLTGGSASNSLFVGTPGSFQALVYQGMVAPSGGTISNASNFVLNSTGQAVFMSNLTGGSSPQGIFVGAPGSTQTLALIGNVAPGGGIFDSFSQPTINSSGKVAFRSNLAGGPSTTGFYSGVPGLIEVVALHGGPAPQGSNFFSLSPATPLINQAGQVAFQASNPSPGIFAGLQNALQAVARASTATPIGGNYNMIGFPALNSAGQVAFSATITGGPTSSAIFVGQPGSLQPIAQSGTAAPSGGNYSLNTVNTPILNGQGQIAFLSSLTGGIASEGIFLGLPGAVQTVALTGTSAPAGGAYSVLNRPLLNGVGQVAFTSTLSGIGVISSVNDDALFAGLPGSIVQVVREGDSIDVDPSLGVDLRTVANSGISIYNISSGGEDGKGISFNSNGLLVYKLTFTDSSVGIFYSQIATIPEPGSFYLLAAGGFLFYTIRKRRS